MIVVTTETIPGLAISHVVGEVMGVTARAANAYTEGLKGLSGKSSKMPAAALARWRRDAIREMIAEADRHGADAIIGMKFDTRQITPGWSEICAYGTAVRLVASVPRGEPARVSAGHYGRTESARSGEPGRHHVGRVSRHRMT